MEESLDNIISNTLDLPTLPIVATRVLSLVDSDDDVSINKLQDIISGDQTLASRVLRISNSAFFGLSRKILTIHDAIIILGLQTLKHIVIAASIKDINKNFGLFEKMLWEHALGASIAAGLIAQYINGVRVDEVIIAGLMHDVGKNVINNNLSDKYIYVIEDLYIEKGRFHTYEKEELGFDHADVGGLIAQKWKLPEKLEKIIKFHHNCTALKDAGTDIPLLCNIVNLADSLCLLLGIGYKEPMFEVLPKYSYITLGLDSEIDNIISKFKTAFTEKKLSFID